MNARWYDSSIGRFISADTIVPDPANPQAYNRYAYVFNNPINYTDPDGHDPHWCNGDFACMGHYGYADPLNAAWQVEQIDPSYGSNVNRYDDHPWAAPYVRALQTGELSVPDGMSANEYVTSLVVEDILTHAQNSENYSGFYTAMAIIGGAEAGVLFYEMLIASDAEAMQVYAYAHADGDILDELPGGNSSFIDGMGNADASRYQKYWEGHAPESSSPFNTIRRYNSGTGEIKQVTTYDEFGDRYAQYDLIDSRRGEHMHTFEYNNYRRPKGLRSGHLPLD